MSSLHNLTGKGKQPNKEVTPKHSQKSSKPQTPTQPHKQNLGTQRRYHNCAFFLHLLQTIANPENHSLQPQTPEIFNLVFQHFKHAFAFLMATFIT
jgi:hypothetical protein